MTFPYISIEGSPSARGQQYGERARPFIEKSLEIYLPAFAAKGLEWSRVHALASEFAESLQAYEPEYVEEMEGIARGASLDLEHIVAINARTEILYWQSEGCTGAACMPEVTAEGHVLLGQNWDWRPACQESAIILHIVPDRGPEILTFVEAGLLGRAGLNSAGIGVTGNFLQSNRDFGRRGIPIPFIRRRILSSESLAEAIGWVVRTPRAFSSNHLIADAGGFAIDCESAPERVFFLYPTDGILEHSNHFCSPVAQMCLEDTGIARYPDTLYRDKRVRSKLMEASGKVNRETYMSAFRDHYGLPNSVCRHTAKRIDGTEIMTVSSLIMDLEERSLWVAPGPVCINDFVNYKLGKGSSADAI